MEQEETEMYVRKMNARHSPVPLGATLLLLCILNVELRAQNAAQAASRASSNSVSQPVPQTLPTPCLQIGLAVRDITPEVPIRLAGYEGRKRPADKIDDHLVVQAIALKNPSGERMALVSLDNCEVSHDFMQPVLQTLSNKFDLPRGAVAVISSHTHSAPILSSTLIGMPELPPEEAEIIEHYSQSLQSNLVEVVTSALEDLKPCQLEYGVGRATFAMNRRVYAGDAVSFGDNPDGPTDWDVPVLRVKGTNDQVRAILFGYACHGTSVRTGDEWYAVSGDYMAYAREFLEQQQPGAIAMYLTGMGADSDPSPRGHLLEARRHGLELAGAVISVLDRPMRSIQGPFKLAFDEVELPLPESPNREALTKDAQSESKPIKQRAEFYLKLLDEGKPPPKAVTLPVGVVRLGNDLTIVLVGGEVVVDYARRLKRLLAQDHPWTVGYAYEIPCYIPSTRLLKEGGYEAESSLTYYGIYGPLRTSSEDILVNRIVTLSTSLRNP
jgi:hypothetical protein